MFCGHCGGELPDNSAFCNHCGAKTEAENEVQLPAPENEVQLPAPENEVQLPAVENEVQMAAAENEIPLSAENMDTGGDKKTKIIVISVIALCVTAAALTAIFATRSTAVMSDAKAAGLIEDARAEVIAQNFDEARGILKKIHLGEDSAYKTEVEELNQIARTAPVIKNVDTGDYPNITLELACSAKTDAFVNAAFKVDEENALLPVTLVKTDNSKTFSITYMAEGAYETKAVNPRLKFICFGTLDFSVPFHYKSMPVNDAIVSFVTSNVINYPEISLYFKVQDGYGQPIDNYDLRSFRIREKLGINDFTEREILSVAKLDGAAALNVSLVIDKSDSIDDASMSKIKSATNDFLSKLQFNSGDKAGVISFDSYVMEMCAFTNNRDYLTNGVNSMYPYGLTACYDAIIKGINNSANQSGARCVIAFTDGMDNESTHSYYDVISIANEKSVPVYIIGVGYGVDETALRDIASSTGGTYHHIDDVSDMSTVYGEIFKEQKSMYCITYKSSESISVTEGRTIYIDAGGRGFRGMCSRDFTPVIPVSAAKHSSRYELIPADISWEEANTLCNQKGGHLATITSQSEADTIIGLAEKSGKSFVWLGGYTTNSYGMETVGHWITGEPWSYEMWMEGEPSRFDNGEKGDGAAEFYLMLWKLNGKWSWNDQRNDLINSEFSKIYKGKMAYVIEYEE